MKTTKWTPEEIEQLSDMFLNKNMTTPQIAAKIGRSRDAVTGKLSALGMRKSDTFSPTMQKAVKLRREANNGSNQFKGMHRVQALLAQQEKVAEQPPLDIPADAKPLHELQVWECKYPYGDSDYKFCGKTTMKLGCAWCKEHYAVVYTKRENDK